MALAACARSYRQPDDVPAPLAPDSRSHGEPDRVAVLHVFEPQPSGLLGKLALSICREIPGGVARRRRPVWRRRRGVLDCREAVVKIEAALAASPIEPFFGSATDYDLRLITQSLARQGSALRPDLIQHGASASIWLIAGPRRCRVWATCVECFDRQKELCVICANVDDVVALARRFLENGVTAGELAADPRVLRPCVEIRFNDEGNLSIKQP